MQLVSGKALAPLAQQLQDLPNDEPANDDDRQKINRNQGRQKCAVLLRGVKARQGEDCQHTDRQGDQNGQVTEPVFREPQDRPARPCLRRYRHACFPDQIPSSRIRLRSVLRLMPRMSAALT